MSNQISALDSTYEEFSRLRDHLGLVGDALWEDDSSEQCSKGGQGLGKMAGEHLI